MEHKIYWLVGAISIVAVSLVGLTLAEPWYLGDYATSSLVLGDGLLQWDFPEWFSSVGFGQPMAEGGSRLTFSPVHWIFSMASVKWGIAALDIEIILYALVSSSLVSRSSPKRRGHAFALWGLLLLVSLCFPIVYFPLALSGIVIGLRNRPPWSCLALVLLLASCPTFVGVTVVVALTALRIVSWKYSTAAMIVASVSLLTQSPLPTTYTVCVAAATCIVIATIHLNWLSKVWFCWPALVVVLATTSSVTARSLVNAPLMECQSAVCDGRVFWPSRAPHTDTIFPGSIRFRGASQIDLNQWPTVANVFFDSGKVALDLLAGSATVVPRSVVIPSGLVEVAPVNDWVLAKRASARKRVFRANAWRGGGRDLEYRLMAETRHLHDLAYLDVATNSEEGKGHCLYKRAADTFQIECFGKKPGYWVVTEALHEGFGEVIRADQLFFAGPTIGKQKHVVTFKHPRRFAIIPTAVGVLMLLSFAVSDRGVRNHNTRL